MLEHCDLCDAVVLQLSVNVVDDFDDKFALCCRDCKLPNEWTLAPTCSFVPTVQYQAVTVVSPLVYTLGKEKKNGFFSVKPQKLQIKVSIVSEDSKENEATKRIRCKLCEAHLAFNLIRELSSAYEAST